MSGCAGDPAAPAPSRLGAAGPAPARHADGPAWVAVIPALTALAVTLYQIQRPSLWRDEGATLAAVHRSLPQLLRMLGHTDVVNGAYYVLMWFVTRAAGTSALALRFPSAAGMAVAAGVTAALGRRLLSARAGLAAGLVFAALPSVTWYAQNARR
jgi:mannosyltransferase